MHQRGELFFSLTQTGARLSRRERPGSWLRCCGSQQGAGPVLPTIRATRPEATALLKVHGEVEVDEERILRKCRFPAKMPLRSQG